MSGPFDRADNSRQAAGNELASELSNEAYSKEGLSGRIEMNQAATLERVKSEPAAWLSKSSAPDTKIADDTVAAMKKMFKAVWTESQKTEA